MINIQHPFICVDAETLNMLPTKGKENLPGYDYARSWGDHKGMGISMISLVMTGGFCEVWPYHLNPEYCRKRATALMGCVNPPTVITFNGRAFDDKLFKAHDLPITTDYDLYLEILLAVHDSFTGKGKPRDWSYSLDTMARANLAMGKATPVDDAQAPQLWQDGRYKEAVDYNLNDSWITARLVELGLLGKLFNPNNGDKLRPLRSFAQAKTEGY